MYLMLYSMSHMQSPWLHFLLVMLLMDIYKRYIHIKATVCTPFSVFPRKKRQKRQENGTITKYA